MHYSLKIALLASGLGLTGCTVIICTPRAGCDRIVNLPPAQGYAGRIILPPPVGEFPPPFHPPIDKPLKTGPDTSRPYRDALKTIDQSSGYVGPGDLVPGATAYYGLRAYDAAYARSGTGKAIEIRRAKDNALADIVILKSGQLDIDALHGFCASTACFVAEWYDQSGHGNDISQTLPSQQPEIVFDGFRKFPIVQFSYDRSTYLSGSFGWVSGNSGWTAQAAILKVEPTAWYEPILDYGTTMDHESLFALVHDDVSYQPANGIYGTVFSSRTATSAPSSLAFYSDGTTLGGYVNGAEWGQPFRDSNIAGDAFNLGGSPAQSNTWLTAGIGEVILYPTSLPTAKVKALEASERTYYGF
jgi:hypothetical protein